MSLMSTTFEDGPAKGHRLALRRSPVLLRVVVRGDEIDALDQHDDTARDGETIVVYRLTSAPSECFIDGRDPKTGRRFGEQTSAGHYAVCPEQPDDATARDNAKWREWCRVNKDRLMPLWAKGAVMP